MRGTNARGEPTFTIGSVEDGHRILSALFAKIKAGIIHGTYGPVADFVTDWSVYGCRTARSEGQWSYLRRIAFAEVDAEWVQARRKRAAARTTALNHERGRRRRASAVLDAEMKRWS